jgi:CRP/FNR family transcriptional regulator
MLEPGLLRAIPYFSELSDEELNEVGQYFFEESYIRDEIIFLEGDEARNLYFVASGVVKTFKTSSDGKEQTIELARPGDVLNEVAVFDGGPNPTSAQAITPVRLYKIEKSKMLAIISQRPVIALEVLRLMAAKMRRLTELVEDLSFRPVVGRVAKILLEQARAPLVSRLSQREMAAMAGTAREMVSRSLKTLEDEGAIKMERNRVVILDPEALERRAA